MTVLRVPTIAALLALTTCLAFACGDEGSGGPGGGIEPTFTAIYENVLSDDARCLECHDSRVTDEFFADLYMQGGELDFSTKAAAYDLLVGEAADGDECDGFGTLVVPGDPDASILVSKVEDESPLCGDPMPFLGDLGVSAAEATAIREWIRLGAPND